MKNEEILIQKITTRIRKQMADAEARREIEEAQLLDIYALGYLFGFSSGAITHQGVRRYREKIYLLTQVYGELFGNYSRLLLEESLDLHKNVRFLDGANAGWEDNIRWLSRGETPVGLTRFLCEGEHTLSLADWFPQLIGECCPA